MRLSALNGHELLYLKMEKDKELFLIVGGWNKWSRRQSDANTSELFSIAASIFVLNVIISLLPGVSAEALFISDSDIWIVPNIRASGSVTEVILDPEVNWVRLGLQ